MALNASGIRRTEAAFLKVTDIDRERIVIHIYQGKGSRDHDLPVTHKAARNPAVSIWESAKDISLPQSLRGREKLLLRQGVESS